MMQPRRPIARPTHAAPNAPATRDGHGHPAARGSRRQREAAALATVALHGMKAGHPSQADAAAHRRARAEVSTMRAHRTAAERPRAVALGHLEASGHRPSFRATPDTNVGWCHVAYCEQVEQ